MRSLSLSLFVSLFIASGCGVSADDSANATRADASIKTDAALSTGANLGTGGTATSSSTPALPDASAIAQSDTQVQVTADAQAQPTVDAPLSASSMSECIFDGQAATWITEVCYVLATGEKGVEACKLRDDKTYIIACVNPISPVVNSDASVTLQPDAKVVSTDAIVPTNVPVVITMDAHCLFADAVPAGISTLCYINNKIGHGVCRLNEAKDHVGIVCVEGIDVVVTTPDAGTPDAIVITLDTHAAVDTTNIIVVKTDASAMDTTPVVPIDSGAVDTMPVIDTTPATVAETGIDTLGNNDALVSALDADPLACADIACSMAGCATFAVQHCYKGELMACTCVHANFPGPAILDCQKDSLGNYTFTLWGVRGQAGIGGNMGLEGGFFYTERGTPANVCLAGTHNNWALEDCKVDPWGPYQTYQITKSVNMVGKTVNVVGSAPNGLRWGDFDPYDADHSHLKPNVGTIMPAGLCQLTEGGVLVTSQLVP